MTDAYTPQGGAAGKSVPGTASLADQAKTLGKDLKTTAAELSDTVARVAKEQADDIGSAAKDLAADATGRVEAAVNEQKSASANYLGAVAQAVHRAAGEFESEVPQAAQYIRQAAGQIETVANAVRQRDMRELVGEVQGFARRQPTLFFGGAVVLGFAALRFLKSSSPSGSAPAKSSGTRTGDHAGAQHFSSTRSS